MRNKEFIQVPPAESMGIYENKDNKLLINILDSRVHTIQAICDGEIKKDKKEGNLCTYVLIPEWNKDFKIYYQSYISVGDKFPRKVKAGDIVACASGIPVGAVREIYGFYFWVTYKDERINPLIVLNKTWLTWNDNKEIKTKSKRQSNKSNKKKK